MVSFFSAILASIPSDSSILYAFSNTASCYIIILLHSVHLMRHTRVPSIQSMQTHTYSTIKCFVSFRSVLFHAFLVYLLISLLSVSHNLHEPKILWPVTVRQCEHHAFRSFSIRSYIKACTSHTRSHVDVATPHLCVVYAVLLCVLKRS